MIRSTLPILISLPHAGLKVPDEVLDVCILNESQIRKDGDEGAYEAYSGLRQHVAGYVTTEIARAIVDMNRGPDDFRKDGVIKTHTCWNEPVYRKSLPTSLKDYLIQSFHHRYHEELDRIATQQEILFGIDCHTMAATGPPVGPDPGQERPLVCLGNLYDQSCSPEQLRSFADCLEQELQCSVAINRPFSGGYIIRRHSSRLPWMMIELSRTHKVTWEEKAIAIERALERWCAFGLQTYRNHRK